jgi:hypothetical protein
MDHLSSTFLECWSSLPDELKLHILRYVLPSNENYREYDFRSWKYSQENTGDLKKLFYPLLSIGHCKHLALEVLYSQNRICIWHEPELPGTIWPPKHVFQHIRSIELSFKHMGTSILDLLRTIADGTAGFRKLHSMKLDASSQSDMADFHKTFAAIDIMEFPTRVLEIEYKHWTATVPIEGYGFGKLYDTFEMALLDKFTVQGRNENTTVSLERYHVDRTGEKEIVDGWPDISYDLRTRYTRKVVSLYCMLR